MPDAVAWNRAIEPRVRVITLCVQVGLALLLLASWMGPAFLRQPWDRFDSLAFALGNGSLEAGSYWTTFWAFCNTRGFDAIVAGTMLALCASWAFSSGGRWWRERIWFGAMMAGFIAFWMIVVMKLTLAHHRASPTRVLPGAFRLSEQFDWFVRVKDSAKNTFPGDHVGVTIFVGLVLLYVAGPSRGVPILLLSLFVAVPRVVAGAHWATDQVVGGSAAGLLGASVFLGGLLAVRRLCSHLSPADATGSRGPTP